MMRCAFYAGLLAASLVPGIAYAQDPGAVERHEMREDRHDLRVQQHDLRQDYRNGAPPGQIRADRHDVAIAQHDLHGDWRDYRRLHPEAYRGPEWVGPRGYGYRPVPVGYRFAPPLYDQRYWIDPVRYHLHPIYGPQRWVRYGDDVLLIDTRNGQVLEVNGGFFL